MTAISFAFVIAGLFLLVWAIIAPRNTGAARRATAGSVGIIALLIGLFLGSDDHHDKGPWS
jgi:hypothetical protein